MKTPSKAKPYVELARAQAVKLKDVPTSVAPSYKNQDEYDALLAERHNLLSDLQTLLYADGKRSVLVVLQGMDTAGKDGAIRHVMSGVNPQGCQVVSFKKPSATELDHDFLWRVHRALPCRGNIGIFNRSYYEDVLVTRVHPELLQLAKLGTDLSSEPDFWEHRYSDIVHFEKYLHRQGYTVIKIFLHISKAEQKKRLLARFDDPKKHWKLSEADIKERGFWADYQSAYEACLEHTSTKRSPWYVVPADDKKQARLSISRILVERLQDIQLTWPKLSPEDERKLGKWKKSLEAT